MNNKCYKIDGELFCNNNNNQKNDNSLIYYDSKSDLPSLNIERLIFDVLFIVLLLSLIILIISKIKIKK